MVGDQGGLVLVLVTFAAIAIGWFMAVRRRVRLSGRDDLLSALPTARSVLG